MARGASSPFSTLIRRVASMSAFEPVLIHTESGWHNAMAFAILSSASSVLIFSSLARLSASSFCRNASLASPMDLMPPTSVRMSTPAFSLSICGLLCMPSPPLQEGEARHRKSRVIPQVRRPCTRKGACLLAGVRRAGTTRRTLDPRAARCYARMNPKRAFDAAFGSEPPCRRPLQVGSLVSRPGPEDSPDA